MTYVLFTLVPIIILCGVYIINIKENYERKVNNVTNINRVLNDDLEKYLHKMSRKDVEDAEAKYVGERVQICMIDVDCF